MIGCVMAKRAQSPSAPSECAQCGAEIPRKAAACPECGADERTGWRERSVYDDIDLPDEAWEDDDAAAADGNADKRETEDCDPHAERGGLPWYWSAVALTLILLFALLSIWMWPRLF